MTTVKQRPAALPDRPPEALIEEARTRQRRRHRRAAVAVLLAAAAAAVVAGIIAGVTIAGRTADQPRRHPSAAAAGTLTGHLYAVGGPVDSTLPLPGTVTVQRRGVHLNVPVGARGTFSVTVPAGRYTVVGHSPLYGSGEGLCRAAKVVTVTSGHTTNADVLCQMS
jgi:hypothetical protein